MIEALEALQGDEADNDQPSLVEETYLKIFKVEFYIGGDTYLAQ